MADRLLYPLSSETVSRDDYDRQRTRRREDFTAYRIVDGHGLIALPISMDFRHIVRPQDENCLNDVNDFLHWFANENDRAEPGRIALSATIWKRRDDRHIVQAGTNDGAGHLAQVGQPFQGVGKGFLVDASGESSDL